MVHVLSHMCLSDADFLLPSHSLLINSSVGLEILLFVPFLSATCILAFTQVMILQINLAWIIGPFDTAGGTVPIIDL